MRIKKIVKAVTFCVILALFLNHIYQIFSWKDTAGEYYSTVDSFYELDEDLVDVLFLGSSRCYCSINNAVLWEEQGISSFSFSISGQDIVSSYHSFVEALKTQTPDVVCFELYGTTFLGYGVESNMYRNTLPFKLSSNAVSAVKNIAPDRQGELLLRWPIVHTRYAELEKEDFETDLPTYIGYHSEFVSRPVEPLCSYKGTETLQIGEGEEMWLRKIIALAEENDIELCFFVAPAVTSETEQKKYNYVETIAREHNIPVLNMAAMEKELQINTAADFLDPYHTNYFGAQKVSSFIANFLKQNYDLPDRRGTEGYELWEENSKVRRHEFQNQVLKSTYIMPEYMDLLTGIDDYTVVVATSGEYLATEADFEDYVYSFGLEGFYDASGIWVLDNGNMIYQKWGQDTLDYMDLSNGDLAVCLTDGNCNIVVDKKTYTKVLNGINVLVYDNILGKVVDAVGFEATKQYEMVR